MPFPLLKLVSESRATYGLKHQDHSRYHSHCTNKISSLRKSCNLTQTSTKARKYTKKEVTASNAKSSKHLQILLYQAERSWSAAQLVKAILTADSSSKIRHDFHKKLSKATSYATNLLELCTSLYSSSAGLAITAVELGQVIIYTRIMGGILEFEKSEFEKTLNELLLAKAFLEILEGRKGKEGEELSGLGNELEDLIEPLLRISRYKLGIQSDSTAQPEGLEKYAELVAVLDAERGEKELSSDFTFRDTVISIRNLTLVGVFNNVREVLKLLAKDQSGVREERVFNESGKKWGKRKAVVESVGGESKKVKELIINGKRMELFDRTLLVLTDGELIARQLVEDNKIAQQKLSLRSEIASIPLNNAHNYLVYQLLTITVTRDLLLIDSALSSLDSKMEKVISTTEKKLNDFSITLKKDFVANKLKKLKAKAYPGIVRLFDAVLESLEKVRDLEIVEKDGELSIAIEGRINLVKTRRTLYVAMTFALVEDYAAALSLIGRGKLYLRQTRQNGSEEEEIGNKLPLSMDFSAKLLPTEGNMLIELEEIYSKEEIQIQKAWTKQRNGQIVIEDMDIAVEGEVKAEKKLPFYDIAFNYVVAFDLDAIAIKAGLMKPSAAMEVTSVGGGETSDFEMKDLKEEVEKVEKKSWFGLFGRN